MPCRLGQWSSVGLLSGACAHASAALHSLFAPAISSNASFFRRFARESIGSEGIEQNPCHPSGRAEIIAMRCRQALPLWPFIAAEIATV